MRNDDPMGRYKAELELQMEREAEIYLDFVNNFLTVEKFAEHYGMTEKEAQALIDRNKPLEKNRDSDFIKRVQNNERKRSENW
jgi:hypothetical protein